MKNFAALACAVAFGGALVVSAPASAFHARGGFHGERTGSAPPSGWNGGWTRWSAGWTGWGWGSGFAGLGNYGLELQWGYDSPPFCNRDYGYNECFPDYAYLPFAAPVEIGRSVATRAFGDFCTTPARTCQLLRATFVGASCSCPAAGGRARGSVTP